jgi:molybdenum cofactor cytidylyltransferase
VSPVSPVFAIILAAGRSSRFGSDKLLAPLQGRTVLGHVLDTAAASARDGILRAVFLVVRDAASEEARLGQDSGAITVVADRAGEGLALSLRAGLERVADTTPASGAAALILLGDQPGVSGDVIAELVRRWRATGASVLRPRYADAPIEPGHPVLLASATWPAVSALEGDAGAGQLLNQHAVTLVDVTGRNPDIDTPADLAAFPLQEST